MASNDELRVAANDQEGVPEFTYRQGEQTVSGGAFPHGDRHLMFEFSANDVWEKYEGVPFPSKLSVLDTTLPGGWMEASGTRVLPDGRIESTGASAVTDFSIIQYTFEMWNGTPECIEVIMAPAEGSQRGVRAKDREYVKIDDVLEAALIYLAHWQRSPLSSQYRRTAVNSLMRRRRTTPEDVLRDTARVYEENIDDAPTQAVADHFGISKSGADKRVKRARDAGFITKTAHTGRKPEQ
jgi:hypothetical protein